MAEALELLLVGYPAAKAALYLRQQYPDHDPAALLSAAHALLATSQPDAEAAIPLLAARLSDLYGRFHEAHDYGGCLAVIKEQIKLLAAGGHSDEAPSREANAPAGECAATLIPPEIAALPPEQQQEALDALDHSRRAPPGN